MSFDRNLTFEEALEQSFKKVHTGERVKGYIAAVNNSEAIVDIGTKHTGYVPLSELTDDQTKKPSDIVSVGDEVELIVTKINDQEGIIILSKKKLDELVGFDNIAKAKDEDKILEGIVTNVVKGGILVSVDGVRVFVPASQTGVGRDKSLDELKNKTVQLKVIEVNESRRCVVGSIKAVAKAQKEAAKAAFWETAEVGKTYKGEVKSLTSYGAFVDLGGIDGMVHISELTDDQTKKPSDIVSVGDEVELIVTKINDAEGIILLKSAELYDKRKAKRDSKINDKIISEVLAVVQQNLSAMKPKMISEIISEITDNLDKKYREEIDDMNKRISNLEYIIDKGIQK